MTEILIVTFYWSLIEKTDNIDHCGYEIKSMCLSKILDNSIPLTLILIEFSYNAVPFCRRHLIFIIGISVIYLVANFVISKKDGSPVYAILDWSSPLGFIVPFLLIAYAIVIFLMLEWISTKKLLRNDLNHIINIIQGKVGSK